MGRTRRIVSWLFVSSGVAVLAGCSLIVSFDAPPAAADAEEDAGTNPTGRDASTKPPPPPGEDAGVVASTTPPCDPDLPLSTLLFDDTLAADGKLAPATGFPAGSWAYTGGSYNQTRLADAADATLFASTATVEDVDVQASAASTAISAALTPRLRQIFILVGATSSADAFSAYGCGIEIVEGLNPEARTSVVKLSGTPGGVTTTSIERTARQQVNINEVFKMRAHVKSGTLTCTVTQGAANTVTTATATGRTDLKGGVGFFTRQTRGAFQRARVCRAGG